MTLDNATSVTASVNASNAQSSKVDYVLDDECGYVLDMAAFMPEGQEAYVRAVIEATASAEDLALDVPSLESKGFMRVPADAVAAPAEVDEYDYESQVFYALDDEHGFVLEQETIAAASESSDAVDSEDLARVEAGARSTRRLKVAGAVDEAATYEPLSA